MGRFDIFPIFIATFASRRVTLIATHSKSQKQTRLPIRYLYFILPFKPLINKEVIKVFQNYCKKRNKGRRFVFRTESPFNFIEISIFVTRFFEFEF